MSLEIRRVDDTFAVSPQIEPADAQALAGAGFKTLICNRPDGEEPGQPSTSEIGAAAAQAGLAFHFIPVIGRSFTDDVIQAFARVRHAAEEPMLAYCRSGTRSITLETLANPAGRSVDERLSRASAAGYDLSGLRSRLGDRNETLGEPE